MAGCAREAAAGNMAAGEVMSVVPVPSRCKLIISGAAWHQSDGLTILRISDRVLVHWLW